MANYKSNTGLYLYTRDRFKNVYELLDIRALKFSTVNEIYIFQCIGKIFCVIPHKISCPYIERDTFYITLEI